MRQMCGLRSRSWSVLGMSAILSLMVSGRAWAQNMQAAPCASAPAPQQPSFSVTKPTKVTLDYSTQLKDNGLGFKVREVKPAKGSEEIDITTTMNPWPASIKVTIKFGFKGDSGTVVITKETTVSADANGQYPVKLADPAAAAGTRVLDTLPGDLNNSVDAGKQITLEKCEITLVPVPAAPGFQAYSPGRYSR